MTTSIHFRIKNEICVTAASIAGNFNENQAIIYKTINSRIKQWKKHLPTCSKSDIFIALYGKIFENWVSCSEKVSNRPISKLHSRSKHSNESLDSEKYSKNEVSNLHRSRIGPSLSNTVWPMDSIYCYWILIHLDCIKYNEINQYFWHAQKSEVLIICL